MQQDSELLYREIAKFIDGSAAGFIQLLVATARRSTFERIIDCPTYPAPARSSGLSVASKCFVEATLRDDIHLPTFLSRLFASVRSLERRKYTGQFFTAGPVAMWALSLVRPQPADDVCDAGAGTCVFGQAILNGGFPVRSYVGIENDPILALCGAHVLEANSAPKLFKVWYANFLLLRVSDFRLNSLGPPMYLISNPPFIRFHNLKGRGRVRKELKSSLGITLSSLSGAANYFVSRSADLMRCRPDGDNLERRMLFFLPKEAEGALHTRRLWDDLQKLQGWSHTRFDIKQNQTGIEGHPSNALALLYAFELKTNPVQMKSSEGHPDCRLRDLLNVRRGISTGCNRFFVLTDEEVRQRKLPDRHLRPVLPTRIRLPENCFTKKDWDSLRAAGNPCWLLSLPAREIDDFEPSIQDYLREGLRRGVHETPTAQSLRTWFSIPLPSMGPPHLFVTYLFRRSPRFVINEAKAYNLTNILGARFIVPPRERDRTVIVDSLNRFAPTWTGKKMAGREYRDGLMKIEPRELSMLPIDSELLQFVLPHVKPSENESLSLFE